MILKLSALRVFTFGRYAQSEKTTVSFWIVSTKNVFLTALTRWLSLYPSLPNMLQIFPALQSYIAVHVHQQAICCSETFFGKSSERIRFKTFAIICGCF